MTPESLNYQCPSCNGALEFSAEAQKVECPYCGSLFEPAYIEQLYAQRQQQRDEEAASQVQRAAEVAAGETDAESGAAGAPGAASVMGAAGASAAATGAAGAHATPAPAIDAATTEAAAQTQAEASVDPVQAFLNRAPWTEAESLGMRSYTCSSCAASLTVDATTAVTECPYCGNRAVLPGTLAGLTKPDYVVPFKTTKADAIAALKGHYAKMRFLPDAFTEQSHLEHIQGVYVPFWLYSLTVDFDARFECTNVRTFHTKDERITETDFYDVSRVGSVSFERLPVDGSTKMPDAHMDAIEPFDYGEMQPFSVAYLPGYVAERYDLAADACFDRADERVRSTVPTLVAKTVVGYDMTAPTGCHTTNRTPAISYALLPVWMLHTTWNGGSYLFAMNGQTGKLIGDLPIDKGKVAKFFAVRFAIAFVVAAIVCFVGLNAMGGL